MEVVSIYLLELILTFMVTSHKFKTPWIHDHGQVDRSPNKSTKELLINISYEHYGFFYVFLESSLAYLHSSFDKLLALNCRYRS